LFVISRTLFIIVVSLTCAFFSLLVFAFIVLVAYVIARNEAICSLLINLFMYYQQIASSSFLLLAMTTVFILCAPLRPSCLRGSKKRTSTTSSTRVRRNGCIIIVITVGYTIILFQCSSFTLWLSFDVCSYSL
jgi:hypothetical protein